MTNISKLASHISSNSCLLDTNSLYYGKAGISLALFEASRYLRSNEIEAKAFDLFQESLILKSSNYSFESGLSGIGYVLCYLIKNRFIEADFDEIFGKQYEKIINSIEGIDKRPNQLLNSLQVIYFISAVNKIKQDDARLPNIIKKIFEGLELFLIIQFHDFLDDGYINDKMMVLRIYETYLKLIDFTDYRYLSNLLLESYADLYRKGRVVSSVVIGFYMGMLVRKNNLTGYDDIVSAHIINGIKNIYEDLLSLKEKIDILKLLFDIENNGIMQLPGKKNDILIDSTNINLWPLHYKGGLTRLLLFSVNKQIELL